MKTWYWFVLRSMLLIPLMLIGLISCKTDREIKKPNIIIIFSDELDPGYIGAYGGNYPTPNIDALAGQGLRLDNAYTSAPMCTPSRYSILTGQYPGRCTDPDFLKEYPRDEPYSIGWNTHIHPGAQTIPRLLASAGYVTGMAGKWHIGKLPKGIKPPRLSAGEDFRRPDFQKKLAEFQIICANKIKEDAGFDKAYSVLWGNFDGGLPEEMVFHNDPWITRGALRFIDEVKQEGKPFFLYVATTAIHGPNHAEDLQHDLRYTPEGRMDDIYDYQFDVDAVKNAIEGMPSWQAHRYVGMASLDHHVKLIIRKLKEQGLFNNTLIFFAADHNVEPGKAVPYEKGFRIPFIVDWPGHIQPGSTSEQLVQTVDILPTILDIAGLPAPRGIDVDGVSMISLLTRNKKIRDYVYLESGFGRAVTDGRYKYLTFRYPHRMVDGMMSGKIKYAPYMVDKFPQDHSLIAVKAYPAYFDPSQFFDLQQDPYEQHNLAGQPGMEQRMAPYKAELEKRVKSFKHAYHWDTEAFMKTAEFKKLAEKTRAQSTDNIIWIKRDHGQIIWPPVSQ